ncbi:hypothetical protein DEI95_08235 [Curtobacterium sp. MCBD17_008]|nr:hypothetical protein DEI95_08235 [Curtobacterium sp. MCBD17_008]
MVLDDDGVARSIEEVRELRVVPPLWCAGQDPNGQPCRQRMRVKALHSTLKSPHFAGGHIGGCDHGSHRSEDRPGDVGHLHPVATGTAGWRVVVGEDAPTTGPDGRRRPDDQVAGTTTRRYVPGPTTAGNAGTGRRHLESVLQAAIAGALPPTMTLPGGQPLPASETVVSASDGRDSRFAARDFIVWGAVTVTRRVGSEGATMLLLGDRAQRFGVLIPADLRPRFALARDDEFVGRHAAVLGSRRGAADRPYIAPRDAGHVTFLPSVQVRPPKP